MVSLPVPAVVGTATSGLSAPGTGSPRPMGGLTYARKSAGCVLYRLAALAVSMLEPPPTATKPSNRPATAVAIASWNEASLGSTLVRSYTTASMPAARSDSRATATGSSPAITGSVTSSARRTPSARSSNPSSRVAPDPNLMRAPSMLSIVSRRMTY